MARVHKYKYGGSTTSTHTRCPARVLLGGRCNGKCPYYCGPCSECNGLHWLDHERLVTDKDGRQMFVSSHHGGECPFYLENADFEAYLEVHGLEIETALVPVASLPRPDFEVRFRVTR